MRFYVLSLLLLSCQDSDKSTDSGTINEAPKDLDGDGFTTDEDCNDEDEAINPGSTETCDGVDNNCDGEIDEEVLASYYADSDEDGFGNPEIITEACEVPSGFVENGSDCNDTEETAYPGGEELCDAIDNNCDGDTDEGLSETFYMDEDGDGFGNPNQAIEACLVTPGLSPLAEDCNDADNMINPLSIEVCDEIDNNCDGEIDEEVTSTFYQDSDEDGFGTDTNTVLACTAPEGYTIRGGDCDDLETYANPFSIEICDGIDNDCDGSIDEEGAAGSVTYYTDSDEDGFGDDSTQLEGCIVPTGSVLMGGDCDDTTALKNPATFEICDGLDNDCDNSIDNNAVNPSTWYLDNDVDGYGDPSSTINDCTAPTGYVGNHDDCDDDLPEVNPDAAEICDEIDNNCDNIIDTDAIDMPEWFLDEDEDGHGWESDSLIHCDEPMGYVGNSDDCNDLDEEISPDAIELCDSTDNDCDGLIDINATDATTWYLDNDEDGFGDPAVLELDCASLVGYVLNNTDCNDTDNEINPDAIEICNGVDHNCDGIIENASTGSTPSCPGVSCQEIIDLGQSTGDGLYWLDPDQDGDPADSWEAYCDMTRDGGGWTKMESALFPFLFTTSNWEEYGSAADNSYSKMIELDEFENNGTFTLRYEVGDSGDWTSGNRSHYTIWTQEHHPSEETSDGSDYVLLEGQESTTCDGFNGFHDRHYAEGSTYSIMNDVDSGDALGCWWMQAIPLAIYSNGGYLEGYNGANLHQWQSFWIR